MIRLVLPMLVLLVAHMAPRVDEALRNSQRRLRLAIEDELAALAGEGLSETRWHGALLRCHASVEEWLLSAEPVQDEEGARPALRRVK